KFVRSAATPTHPARPGHASIFDPDNRPEARSGEALASCGRPQIKEAFRLAGIDGFWAAERLPCRDQERRTLPNRGERIQREGAVRLACPPVARRGQTASAAGCPRR